jgi:HD-GYP domain-containing protein (c-di-GMP phosphodiesterase class II)/CHASE2 domain-containing sensor protein
MRRRATAGWAAVAAAVVSVAVALAADVVDLMATPEQDAVALRFALRGEEPASDVAVVAIDDVTFNQLGEQWPFSRRLHARAIDALRAAGARAIVYDVQFTEPTRPGADGALLDALARTPGTVLATSESDGRGGTAVLGSDDVVREVRAVVGASNVETDPGGVIQRFPYEVGGLRTLAVVAAERADGHGPARDRFPADGAWIDFRGPPGTIPTVSFSELLRGNVAGQLRDRIVVVGATAPTLQDVHPTPASHDRLMSGPEIQANAIWTALHGLPLRDAPVWLGWVAIVVMGFAPALFTLLGRAGHALLAAPALGLAWLLIVQAAFEQGLILPVSYPFIALLLGTVSSSTGAFVLEREQRRRAALYSEQLEREVSARTEELRQTQLEVVSRLGRAVESRDADTGSHVDRMSALCQRLALAIGMPPAEAELLRHASALHDVGKVGIPDRILRKPGRFDADERAVMETHTHIGADILAGSSSALIQLAAVIARSHHERWDGTGYPDGLRGEEIPLAARIATVCDVFDALLSVRPYKPAWPLADALAELAAERGRQFDPALVDAFVELVGSLEPELLAPGDAAAEIGVLSAPAPETATRSPQSAGSGPADAADTSSSRPAAPSPPARG